MIIYPAIDLKDGKCVRLVQGKFDNKKVYCDDPGEMVEQFLSCGAEYIHTVDLDGALGGMQKNIQAIKRIVDSAKGVPVQLGGGIRSIEQIQNVLDMGVSRAIIGTKAVQDLEFLKQAVSMFGQKIAVGIDAKDGYASTHGWEKVSNILALDLARTVANLGVKTIIYTDIATDGMLSGPNLKAQQEMVSAVDINIIASGGIACNRDILDLKEIGVSGAITGKAIYEGKIDLKRAIIEGRE